MTLIEYAETLGVELLPWQSQFAEAIDRGERPVLVGGLRAGHHFMRKIVRDWEAQT